MKRGGWQRGAWVLSVLSLISLTVPAHADRGDVSIGANAAWLSPNGSRLVLNSSVGLTDWLGARGEVGLRLSPSIQPSVVLGLEAGWDVVTVVPMLFVGAGITGGPYGDFGADTSALFLTRFELRYYATTHFYCGVGGGIEATSQGFYATAGLNVGYRLY